MNGISVQSRCYLCDEGNRSLTWRAGVVSHYLPPDPPALHGGYLGLAEVKAEGRYSRADSGVPAFPPCRNYDAECRHLAEPLGFYVFAWTPKRCRNGRRRWLTWVERHEDGTYTLGNRAH